MMAVPSRVSLWMSRKLATCINCWRMVFTTVFSNSRAEVFWPDTCTVISGIAISGSNDTGMVK